METDREYFERRAAEERRAALAAASPPARASHLEMAERYWDLARAITKSEERVGPSLAA